MHPRAGRRRQTSRLRRLVFRRSWSRGWRGGDRPGCGSVRRRGVSGWVRGTHRGQRRREWRIWFHCRVEREHRRRGGLSSGQNEPRNGTSQCQHGGRARRDGTLKCAQGTRLAPVASWRAIRFFIQIDACSKLFDFRMNLGGSATHAAFKGRVFASEIRYVTAAPRSRAEPLELW